MMSWETASTLALRHHVSHKLYTYAIFLPPLPCQLRHQQMIAFFMLSFSFSQSLVRKFSLLHTPDKYLMPLPPIMHNIIALFPRDSLYIQLQRLQRVFSHCSSSYKSRGRKKSAFQLIGSFPCVFKKEGKMVKLAFKKSSRHLFGCFSELYFSALSH